MYTLIRAKVEWSAVAIGAMLALALLSSWMLPGGSATAPARVTLVAERSTDLDVKQVLGPLGTALLTPASPALVRVVDARNATGGTLTVRLQAAPDDHGLDHDLSLRLRTGDKTIFNGPLADLRARGSRPFSLASHESVRIHVSAWIPPGRKGYGGRDETIPLRFVTAPAENA
jgi:hypothetical protein